jgi:hypothetical protein
MVISPVVVSAMVYMDKLQLRRVSALACAVGVVGLLALFGWAVVTWEARYGAMTGSAIGLRFVYLLATGTELPVIQVGLAGVILRVFAYRRAGLGD